jgi:hypothetical protein
MPNRDFQTNFPQIEQEALIVSQSTFSSLELSPCRWYYGPYRGQKLEPSEQMFYGTVEHAIIESYLLGETNHWQLISPQSAEAIGRAVAEEDGIDLDEKMPFEDRRASWFMDLADAAQQWYHDWWIPIGKHLKLLEVERQYAMKLGDYPHLSRSLGGDGQYLPVWFVTGGIDAVFEDPETGLPHPHDWKTSGRGWSGAQGSALGQKEAYAILYQDVHGVLPEEHTFVVYDRSRRSWKSHVGRITPESVAGYRARMDGWVRYMLDPFHLCTPTDGKQRGWWAKPDWNDVWDRCPSCRWLGDEFDSKESKVKSW